jgi:hypothetical protein
VKLLNLKTTIKSLGLFNKTDPNELRLHPCLPLNKHQEEGNIFTFGVHGSGKSTLIKYLVRQLLYLPHKKLIIFDEKKEYTEYFFKSKSTYLIAPWDKRSFYWAIELDLTHIGHFRQLSEQLIHIDEKQPTWGQGAREIFVALLVTSYEKKELSWKSLSNWLNKPIEIWIEEFELYHPAANKFLTGSDETVSSYISNLSSNIGWIHDLANMINKDSKALSLQSWLNSSDSKFNSLIIQSHPLYPEMMIKLTGAMLQYTTNLILSKPDDQRQQYWMILDELGNIPQNLYLAKWLSVGRSKGTRTIAGTQSVSQLKEVYGENTTETILNLFKNHVVFQCGAIGKTAEVASESLGQVIFERPSQSTQSDGTINFSWHRFTENLVPRNKIVNIKNTKNGVKGFAKLSGNKNVFEYIFPFDKSNKIAHASSYIDWDIKKKSTKRGRLAKREK